MFPILMCGRVLLERILLNSALVAQASKWYLKITSKASVDPSICFIFCSLTGSGPVNTSGGVFSVLKKHTHFYSIAYSYLVSQHRLWRPCLFLIMPSCSLVKKYRTFDTSMHFRTAYSVFNRHFWKHKWSWSLNLLFVLWSY